MKKKNHRPFKEAREFVRSLKLKNLMDWKNYVKSGKKPDDIPGLFVAMKIYKVWKNLSFFAYISFIISELLCLRRFSIFSITNFLQNFLLFSLIVSILKLGTTQS